MPYDNRIRRHRARHAVLLGLVLGYAIAAPGRTSAQSSTDLSGTFTLDKNASQMPREVGFGANFLPVSRGDNAPSGGGGNRRGGRGDSGGGSSTPLPALRPQGESIDDAHRRQKLTDEVLTPPVRLTIVDTADVVTITDDQGRARTVHPGASAESLSIEGTSVLTVARREEGKLIVQYAVADLRQVRYTYSRIEGSTSLAVDVEFLERNKPGDKVRRIYNTADPANASASASAGAGGLASAASGAAPGVPATTVPREGSEYVGLKRIGIVVEEPSSQAVGCGLKRDTLEAAVAKPFTDVGIRTSVNSDEDTYLHVTLLTSTLPSGMCVTRYDWALYSMAPSTLSYQKTSFLAQVLLARKGGLAGSMPAAHGGDVVRGLTDGLVQLAGTVRDANK